MNSKISDTALDLGVFALDSELENSAIVNPLRSADWKGSATLERIKPECFAVAS
jgi:hypothetical protein